MITLKKPHGEIQISEFMSWAGIWFFRVHGDGTVTRVMTQSCEYIDPEVGRYGLNRAFAGFDDMNKFTHITKKEYEEKESITIKFITS